MFAIRLNSVVSHVQKGVTQHFKLRGMGPLRNESNKASVLRTWQTTGRYFSSALRGKTAVITGGNSGIGLATSKLFSEQGASVVLVGRNEPQLKQAVKEIGKDASYYHADFSRLETIRNFSEKMAQDGKQIDVLFSNAAIGPPRNFEDVDEAYYDAMMDTNVKGTFFTIQQLLPLINDNGSIIITASIAASVGMSAAGVYSASKLSIHSFVRSIGQAAIPRQIRVNSITPGYIDTQMLEKALGSKESADGAKQHITPTIPMKRFGTAMEIAQVALFLASEQSSYVTGTDIVVDGGWSNITPLPDS